MSSVGETSLPLLLEFGESLELGMLTLDRDLVVRGWNRWLAAASAISPSQIVGTPLLDAFPEMRGSAAEEALHRALGGVATVWSHRFHRYFLPLPAPAGSVHFDRMQQSARVMTLMRDGEVDGVLVLVQDVSERVAREEELRDALRRAEAGSEAKSEFLASMSHELRTPLSAIVGYMELLEGEMVGPIAPLQKNYLGRVKSAARHLMGIIEEILTFSRIEAGKEEVNVENTDAVAVARGVCELFEPQALKKGLALHVSFPDTPVPLATDSMKLRQILINLVGNALKFTDEGHVALEVLVAEERVIFRVCDTGTGISPEHLDRIFDPFTQVDQSLTRAIGGTGLGLPVSRRLARLLGGDVTVESETGRGATFTVWLPAAGGRTPHG
jgi:signal transduction histidine kinase